ncbi:MAG: hypothetical protein AB7K09_15180 [Planctomycetota bacterium]
MTTTFLPNGLCTGFGTLPQELPEDALEIVRTCTPDLPWWPQLPSHCALESPVYTVLDALRPFLLIDAENARIEVRPDRFDEMLTFLELGDADIPDLPDGTMPLMLDAFAAGRFPLARAVKSQILGPLSLALIVAHPDGVPLLARPACVEALGRYVSHLAWQQIRRLRQCGVPVLLYVEEPALGMLEVAPRMDEWIAPLHDTIQHIRDLGALVGLQFGVRYGPHTALAAKPDIISVEPCLSVYSADHLRGLRHFVEDGGLVSFGIVPACGLAMPHNLLWHAWSRLADRLGEAPDVARRCLITTHTGLHDLSLEAARGAMERAAQLAETVRAVAGEAR